MKINDDGTVNGYVFWPAEKVDELFGKKVPPERFLKEMRNLYRLRIDTDFDPSNNFMDILERLPVDKQVKLIELAVSQ